MSAPIVVGVDNSRASCDAVFWALAEARRRANRVLLVHAPDIADTELASTSRDASPESIAADVVHAHGRHAARLAPDVETTGLVSTDKAPDALVELSSRADLIVVGNRGRLGLAESALGSVSQRVAAHADCPVVVVPQGTSRLVTRRIAVGVATGGAADAVVDVAAAEAARWSATLVLVRAQGTDEADRAAARADLERTASHIHRRDRTLLVEVHAPADEAAAALTAESRNADLLVLGCRHTDDLVGCRLGAIPTALLSSTSCPVLLVGHRD